MLSRSLQSLFGDIEPAALAMLKQELEWFELPGGQTLMTQGEHGDSMYISVSGRLRAYVDDGDGAHLVREMSRGQVIGELSLYTDEPRSATVVAIRNSVLVKLGKDAFHRLLASSPQVSLSLTRQIIRRLQTEPSRSVLASPVTMGLLPVTSGVDTRAFAAALATQLEPYGRVRVVDAAAVDLALQRPGLAQSDVRDTRGIAMWLDHIEAQNDFLLLVGDDGPTPWTQCCSGHCDELLLLADATQPPVLHPTETDCLMQRQPRTEAAEILVLLHAAATLSPRGTKAWLARRPLADHLHLRLGPPEQFMRDMGRLARVQARQAVGLVLAGGGARGFAHLGVWRALQERGIEIDVVGGTSMGAAMGGLIATDQPLQRVTATVRQMFANSPTSDFNLLPMLSLIKGQKMRRVMDGAVVELMGADIDIEDLWKGFFCIAANYSQAREDVVRCGNLAKLVRASLSIPGALPPVVHDGDLLCDGGAFNNFPVDVMRATRGVGRVIGVDLSLPKARRIEFEQVPGTWALLLDRLRPRAKRRYRLPSLSAYLMNVTMLYSASRQRLAQRQTQLYLNPTLERVGLLQWNKFDQIVQQGYAHGLKLLDVGQVAALTHADRQCSAHLA